MSLPASDPTSTSTAQNLATGYISHYTTVDELSDNVLLERGSQNVLADLKALSNIIQSSIEQIETAVTANSLTLPSPDSAFTLESEGPCMHPAVLAAGSLISSAAGQLLAVARPAPLVIMDTMMQVWPDVPFCEELFLTTWE